MAIENGCIDGLYRVAKVTKDEVHISGVGFYEKQIYDDYEMRPLRDKFFKRVNFIDYVNNLNK